MAQTIKLKRSATPGAIPSLESLELGEIAINTYDGKVYIKKDDGTSPDTIVDITGTGGLAGGDFSFLDNEKAIFGTGSDLQIYHDGSDSYITDAGTGSLIIDGSTSTQIKGSSFVILRSSAGENMAVGNADGAFDLYYNGAKKLATTSTGVDVTGSVTADGLTVSSINAALLLMETDTTDVNSRFVVGGGQLYVQTTNDADNSRTNRLTIDNSTGDISFYEDTGTTPKFVWDASAERLGIGTTTPDNTFHVVAGAAGEVAQFTGAIENRGLSIRSETNTDASAHVVFNSQSGGSKGMFTFETDSTERLRITSTGEIVTGGLTSSTGQLHLYKADATGGKLVLQSQVASDATAKITMMSRLLDNTNKNAYIEAYRGNINFGGDAGYGNVGIGTPTPATALDVAGTITATGGNSTEWNNAYSVSRKTYTITPPGTTTTFYPIVLTSPDNNVKTHHFTLGEAGESEADPYNMNALEGWHRGSGWSDTPPGWQMHYSAYDPSEKTILGVYRTVADGYATIIYVRGGETYTITTSSTPTLYSTGWIEGTGPNDIVAMLKDDTGADIAAQADVSQNISLSIDTFNDGPGLYESHPYYHQGATFDGNVGIGTNSPSFKLHVSHDVGGNATFTGGILVENTGTTTGEANLVFKNQDTGSNYWFTGLNQDTNYALSYGPTFEDPSNLFTLTSGGNLGVGGDPDPNERLVVTGSANGGSTAIVVQNEYSLASSVDESTDLQFRFYSPQTSNYTSGAMIRSKKTEDWMTTATASAELVFYTREDNVLEPKMTILPSGYVGIGTTNPQAKLHVNEGPVYIGDYTGTVTPTEGIFLENAAGNSNTIAMYTYNASVFKIESDGLEANIGWGSSSNREVNFVNTGAGSIKVGIGTTSPTTDFEVKNDSPSGNTTIFVHNNSASHAAMFKARGERTGANSDVSQFLTDNSGKTICNIRGVTDTASTSGRLEFWTAASSSNAVVRMTIDDAGNATFEGDVIVSGDLTVNGTTTTVDTDNLTVKDNNITLNYSTGDSSSVADNAGITIQDAVDASTDASLLWKTASDSFLFSHKIRVPDVEIDGQSLTSSNDLDALNDGFYKWASSVPTNAPTAYMVMYQMTDPNQKIQIAWGSSASGKLYVRRADGGAFYAWAQMLTTASASNTYLPLAGGTLTGDLSVPGIILGSGTSNDIQADGKTAYIGSAIFGDSAATNTPLAPVHIKGQGAPALRIEDRDSTNQVYDFISNQGVGLSIVDQTASITPLVFAHTTGNATFAGTVYTRGATSLVPDATQPGAIILANGGSEASPSTDGRGIEFLTADVNNGYGHRIVSFDNSNGDIPLLLQRRNNNAAWTTQITFEGNSNNATFAGAISASNLSGTNTGDEPNASTTVKGIVELATTAETTTGTDATRAVTPDGLKDGYQGSANVTTLGTISSGTWNGTVIDPAYLGTYSETSFSSTTSSGSIEILTFEDGPLHCILSNGTYYFEIKAAPRYGILSVETNFNDTADSSFNLDGIIVVEDTSSSPTVHSLAMAIYRNDTWTLLVNEKINSTVTTFTSPGAQPTVNGSTINFIGRAFEPAFSGQEDYGYNVISDAIFKGDVYIRGTVTGLNIASSTGQGIVELATTAETTIGTDATRAVTPDGLKDGYQGSSNVTTLGTISSGTWNGTAIASAYLDADTAHLSGTQTFTGNKTFSGGLGVSSTVPAFMINDSDATNATNQVGYISFQRQSVEKAWIGYGSSGNPNFTIKNTEGAVTIDSNVDVTGTLTATSKSFDIEHPTKEGMRLRYGSLEGPENGVYVRGRMDGEQVIQLPDYWLGLVHEDTITVNLTSIGPGSVWVESIENNTITVGGSEKFFYHVFAERKDIEKLTVEYDV